MNRFIAIVGGSGSGKTWLTRRLKRKLGPAAGVLSLDDFYRDLSSLPMSERSRVNFDHPDAIDWDHFIHCIERIRSGEPTRLPRYDFSTHTRLPQTRLWKPCSTVLVEGLWLLHRPDLRRLWSHSIFVDCPEELRLKRRIARDQTERGRTIASIQRQFRDHVAPMHDCHVAPQAQHAGFLLNSPIALSELSRILERIG